MVEVTVKPVRGISLALSLFLYFHGLFNDENADDVKNESPIYIPCLNSACDYYLYALGIL
jgi:hypothetical protein